MLISQKYKNGLSSVSTLVPAVCNGPFTIMMSWGEKVGIK